jgi:hypothetical protein
MCGCNGGFSRSLWKEDKMKKACLAVCLLGLATWSIASDAEDSSWSKPVNGLQAQITMKETQVVNGTRIVSAYLTLRNVSGITGSMMVEFNSSKLSVQVVDEMGNELSRPEAVSYSGGRYMAADLLLPYDSSLTFNVSQSGLGIPKGKTALLDFGPKDCWIIDAADGKTYFLKGTLTVEESKKATDERSWRGTIEIPKAEIPLRK